MLQSGREGGNQERATQTPYASCLRLRRKLFKESVKRTALLEQPREA